MTDRRKFLTGLPIAAVAIAAGATAAEKPSVAKKLVVPPVPQAWEQPVLCEPVASGGFIDSVRDDSFPNVAVTNQNGLTVPFYQAFIRDRVVMLNFMSIRDEEHLPATAMLSKVVAKLGDKVGRDVHVYSVTRDPEHDTPARMAEFASRFNAPEGWHFLTSSKQHCADLAFRMYRMGHSTLPGPRKVDVVFYGNGKIGLWGSFPLHIQPEDAAERVTWVMPRQRPADGTFRRAGPRKFSHLSPLSHNRDLA